MKKKMKKKIMKSNKELWFGVVLAFVVGVGSRHLLDDHFDGRRRGHSGARMQWRSTPKNEIGFRQAIRSRMEDVKRKEQSQGLPSEKWKKRS